MNDQSVSGRAVDGNDDDDDDDDDDDINKAGESKADLAEFVRAIMVVGIRRSIRHACAVGGSARSRFAIAGMYIQLIQSSSFDEFYQAYENAQLVDLLDSKGLTQSAAFKQVSEDLKGVVGSSARGVLKSAWYLKSFILSHPNPLQPGERVQIGRAALVDYGWMNCTVLDDYNQLLRAYQQYFSNPTASCLDLRSACIKGRLVGCLEKCSRVTLGKRCKVLLKNFYPLPPPDGQLDTRPHSGLVYFDPNAPILAPTPSSSPLLIFGIVVALVGVALLFLLSRVVW
ncbi:hypothetical protein BKA70DRAFT_1562821 [Coprinopsis sp. MPI-PUGE-AT-0042]|nr:hypothetical protein BKA70DRAFT_1562821 [Coprinopsis sp. MPI-PUGE-AT-0042]